LNIKLKNIQFIYFYIINLKVEFIEKFLKQTSEFIFIKNKNEYNYINLNYLFHFTGIIARSKTIDVKTTTKYLSKISNWMLTYQKNHQFKKHENHKFFYHISFSFFYILCFKYSLFEQRKINLKVLFKDLKFDTLIKNLEYNILFFLPNELFNKFNNLYSDHLDVKMSNEGIYDKRFKFFIKDFLYFPYDPNKNLILSNKFISVYYLEWSIASVKEKKEKIVKKNSYIKEDSDSDSQNEKKLKDYKKFRNSFDDDEDDDDEDEVEENIKKTPTRNKKFSFIEEDHDLMKENYIKIKKNDSKNFDFESHAIEMKLSYEFENVSFD
jgi:hypothetical protein